MKRILAFLLNLIIVFPLVHCDKSKSTTIQLHTDELGITITNSSNDKSIDASEEDDETMTLSLKIGDTSIDVF